ncbi:MAG: ribosome biogenesis GTPase YlqF [Lachnospiraceae bacterium]|nr:ribosome biogenesis GTPase YlqF [Lachnospiraceae bacterium]
MNIQWYPGHMTKTKRMMIESLSLVDIVIELLDARIPLSSKNPDIDELAKNKKRIILLNKADLADSKATEKWRDYFKGCGFNAIAVDSSSGKGFLEINPLIKELMEEKLSRLREKGRIFAPSRVMVAGIPNVGKSTFINKYTGRKSTKVGDKPGVTKGKQWVRIKKDIELLDTPGILWPKFEDPSAGIKLAITGAINDDILNITELAAELIELLVLICPDAIKNRFGVECGGFKEPYDILLKIGEARGFKLKGGVIDEERTAKILLDEYRGGKLGNITLELPE